jgi:hypothetical protein
MSVEVDTKELLTHTEMVSGGELDIPPNSEKCSVRRSEIDQSKPSLARRRLGIGRSMRRAIA